MYGHAKNPMVKISSTTRRLLPESPKAVFGMTPTSAIAKTSSGNARNTSIVRAMTESIQPPKYPAMIPMTTPIPTARAVGQKPISNE